MKPRVQIFLSDIDGTFSMYNNRGSKIYTEDFYSIYGPNYVSQAVYDKELDFFFSQLEEIRSKNEFDKTIFCLCSYGLTTKYMKEYIEKIKSYQSDTLVLGKQFGALEYCSANLSDIRRYESKGMLETVLSYLISLSQYYQIEAISYADDNLATLPEKYYFYQKLLQLSQELSCSIQFYQLNTKEEDSLPFAIATEKTQIVGLNDCLSRQHILSSHKTIKKH